MKRLQKALSLVLAAVLLSALCVLPASAGDAVVSVGKEFYPVLVGSRTSEYTFSYTTARRGSDPFAAETVLTKTNPGLDGWPWADDGGQTFYVENKGDTGKIIGVSNSFNGITMFVTVKNAGTVIRPIVSFTAPADGQYEYSVPARILWSDTELGIDVYVNGVILDSAHMTMTGDGSARTGTVSLKKGQRLAFVSGNDAWEEAENTILVQDMKITYVKAPGGGSTETYYPVLIGSRTPEFTFSYTTAPKGSDPFASAVALTKTNMGLPGWPWENDGGQTFYVQNKGDQDKIIGVSNSFNGITMFVTVKNSGTVIRPIITFTAPETANYEYSLPGRILWSDGELGIDVYVNGTLAEGAHMTMTGDGTARTGNVSLKKGETLSFVGTNEWDEAENTILIQDMKITGTKGSSSTADPLMPVAAAALVCAGTAVLVRKKKNHGN